MIKYISLLLVPRKNILATSPPLEGGGKILDFLEKIQEEIRILAEKCYFKPKNRKKKLENQGRNKEMFRKK